MTPAALAAAALQQAAIMVGSLTPAQLEELVAGRGRLEFTSALRPADIAADPRPSRGPAPCGSPGRAVAPRAAGAISAAVETISRLSARAEVTDYLQRGSFTVPVLKEIARALGPTVPATGRSRADLTRNIVEGTVGFRERSAAMSGGAWS